MELPLKMPKPVVATPEFPRVVEVRSAVQEPLKGLVVLDLFADVQIVLPEVKAILLNVKVGEVPGAEMSNVTPVSASPCPGVGDPVFVRTTVSVLPDTLKSASPDTAFLVSVFVPAPMKPARLSPGARRMIRAP